jgi:two-component system, OmpR family, sensor histidine kinase ChvG
MKRPLGRIHRSLSGKLGLLVVAFVAVPVVLYVTFQQADRERSDLLLRSVQAQSRLVATALDPLLRRADPTTFTNAGDTLARLSDGSARLRLLFRPNGQAGAAGFFLVASAPQLNSTELDSQRHELLSQGVLDDVAQSCSGDLSLSQHYRNAIGREEILTSVVPVMTSAGCWAIIFSYPVDDLLGAALGTPYWRRFEVQLAAGIYLGLAGLTLFVFLLIRRSVVRFEALARVLRLGGSAKRGFAEQNEIAELDGVAIEFDRLVATLGQTAESIRRRAEDNAHAFKTPIAIMRQSLEPLRRALIEGNTRGKRAIEVMEQAVDRLDNLVDDARRLDESVAELLDPPRRPVNLSRLLRGMAKAYQSLAEGRGVALTTDVPDGLNVLGSEELIETAVEAVLDNAIGFSPSGSRVELHLSSMGGRAEIAVADDGPGVPPEHRERIFERGFSVRATAGPGNEGSSHSGIGLWMARRYLQALGGGIRAENRPGRGLLMRIELPLTGIAA